MVESYPFNDFYQRLILHLSQNPNSQKYNKICKLGFGLDQEKLDNALSCQYNVARSLLEARNFLFANISPDPKQWAWSNVHVNEYPNHPWSLTVLKPIWHREAPAGGNSQTPSVSMYKMARVFENKIFKGFHTANYKQVVSFGPTAESDLTLLSIDTGMAGNLLAGNYFDMNDDHLKGRLKVMGTTRESFDALLKGKENHVLKMHPIKYKKKKLA